MIRAALEGVLIAVGIISFFWLAVFVAAWLRSELHIRRLTHLWESQARVGTTPTEEGGLRHAETPSGPDLGKRLGVYDWNGEPRGGLGEAGMSLPGDGVAPRSVERPRGGPYDPVRGAAVRHLHRHGPDGGQP